MTTCTPRPTLSRRGLIASGAAVSAASAVALASGPSSATAGRLPALVPTGTLDRWNHRVAEFGPRLTGTRGHTAYVDWLADELGRAGLRVQRDRLTFDKWVPKRWSLSVDGTPIDVAFYFPYSGETPPAGVTAPLVHLGVSPVDAAVWALAAGKIAVVEVASPPLPIGAAFPETGRYSPDMASPELLVSQPSISDIADAPLLELARDAGVLAVVCIRTGVSDDFATDQYAPFTTAYAGCPALWVGPTAGAELRRRAVLGATATVVLDAVRTRRAATETIWGVLPGSHPSESVVVNTHTDGPNVAEENGGLGLLALVKQWAAVPRSRRRRSLVFVATTGHFQLPQFAIGSGQSASRWIADHPDVVAGRRTRVVAALTLEHLGCREWLDDPVRNVYAPNGRKDVAYCFTTTPRMRSAYLASCRGTSNNRTITAQPVVYVGEGHDFHDAGVATASLIPAMTYLVQSPPDGAVERIDPGYMRGQVATFSHLISRLDELSAKEIGTPAL